MEQVFYPSFKAEAARCGLNPTIVVMEVLGVSQKTAYNKVIGATNFNLVETIKIRDKYFPGKTLDELFLPVSVQIQEGA